MVTKPPVGRRLTLEIVGTGGRLAGVHGLLPGKYSNGGADPARILFVLWGSLFASRAHHDMVSLKTIQYPGRTTNNRGAGGRDNEREAVCFGFTILYGCVIVLQPKTELYRSHPIALEAVYSFC
jgi:hypothetical protein